MQLWIEIISLFFSRFFFLNENAMSFCPGILANPRHLPTDLYIGCTPSNLETIVVDFLRNIEVWSWSADGGKLIAEIGIERLKPSGKLYHSFAIGIEHYPSVIDVFHIGRLDEGVGKILLFRIKWMVNLEAAAEFVYSPKNRDIALEISRKAWRSEIGIVPGKGGIGITGKHTNISACRKDSVAKPASSSHSITFFATTNHANVIMGVTPYSEGYNKFPYTWIPVLLLKLAHVCLLTSMCLAIATSKVFLHPLKV